MGQGTRADGRRIVVSSAYVALAATAVVVVASALYITSGTSRYLNPPATVMTTANTLPGSSVSTTTIAVNGIAALANPGRQTLAQLSGYPQCSTAYAYNTTLNCSVGYVIQGNSTLIVGSINANNTVTMYAYTINGALIPNETIPPTAETYAAGSVIRNICAIKLTVLGISYPQRYVTIGVSHGIRICPT